MDIVWAVLAVVAGFGLILSCLTWLASYARRRGTAGAALRGAIASYDEIFHPHAHRAHVEIVAQSRRGTSISAADPDRRRPR